MVLITNKEEVFVNEDARNKLQSLWNIEGVYQNNIEKLLPQIAKSLEDGILLLVSPITMEIKNN
jgi:hypothetical protein